MAINEFFLKYNQFPLPKEIRRYLLPDVKKALRNLLSFKLIFLFLISFSSSLAMNSLLEDVGQNATIMPQFKMKDIEKQTKTEYDQINLLELNDRKKHLEKNLEKNTEYDQINLLELNTIEKIWKKTLNIIK